MDISFTSIGRVFMSMQLIDVIDILLLWVLLFLIFVWVTNTITNNTRSRPLLIGLMLFIGIIAIVSIFNLKVMGLLLSNSFQVVLIAIVVIFQPELRRALEKFGAIVNTIKSDQKELMGAREACINGLTEAIIRLSDTQTGAIIAIECSDSLQEQVEGGTVIDALPEARLLCNIFYNKAPLHDQAVIIRNFRVHAASCPLPPTTRTDVEADWGARHRAAIGMSEKSDAVVLLVSEETGHVGCFIRGESSIFTPNVNLTEETIRKVISDNMPAINEKKARGIRRPINFPSRKNKTGGSNE